jgi:O-acetyl-ADP-ribose deacetylase (regulator of RNase III)
MRQKVFIGSSGEAMDVCRAVQQELDSDFDVTIWNQGVFRPTYDAIDSLSSELSASDAGVFVLTPDDLTEMRGSSSPTARDNVVFELGMFIGGLGRARTFILVPDKSALRLPSDLTGVTTVRYDIGRFRKQPRAAMGAPCTQIVQALRSVRLEVKPEPEHRVRLDRATSRMSKDLEGLLTSDTKTVRNKIGSGGWPGAISFQLGRITVRVEVGRIQDYDSSGKGSVIVLPANEYFDDGCIRDSSGSLGAFVHRYFEDQEDDFANQIHSELIDIPSDPVYRNDRQVTYSYGIGEAIFLRELEPAHKLILVSVTTERSGVGLHAEPHFIYAALEGIVETMNEHRLNSLVMPVLGSGHGEISLAVGVLFNLLAIRSILSEDRGRHVKDVRLIVFDGNAAMITPAKMNEIISRVAR